MAWPYSGTPSTHTDVQLAIEALVAATSTNLVYKHGLKADCRWFNGSLTGTSLTGSGFTSGDTGKKVVVPGAGVGGAALVATVTYVNATTLTTSVSATANVTNKQVALGTDNGPLLQAWFDSLPSGTGQTAIGGSGYLPAGRYLVTTAVTGKQGYRLLGAGTVSGTEGIYDANGSVIVCGVPGAATLSFVGSGSIAQNGADVERVVFWDTTAGGAAQGTSTCLSIKNMNRFKLVRCSFGFCGTGVKIDYFYPDNTTVGDASWWAIEDCRFATCGKGIDATPGGSGRIEGGDWTGCAIGIDLAPEAVPTRIHGIKMDVGAGTIGIRGRSWMTTISQCAFECVSGAGNAARALDLDGDAAQFYYGQGVKVFNCTFSERGVGPAAHVLLGSNLKRPQLIGNHFFYGTVTNNSVNMERNDTQDNGTGSVVAVRSQPA